jgi:predicted CXXCH cytochrome family protein
LRSFAEATLALALTLAAPAAWAQTAATERCAACHETLREDRLRGPALAARESVHGGAHVGCAGCHGGRPDETSTRAHDPAVGFVARPDLATATERCGACHADARFMRRTSATLPVDQLALFRADAHGHAVGEGRVRAPSCVSCHGAHNVRRVSDPASPVHPSRVADTCGRCHAGPAAVRGARPAAEPPSAWRASVHGRAFVERGNAQAPTCASCHGAHGEFREAGGPDARCGSCHDAEAEAFARSPHAAPFARLGFSGCVQCHGSHAVSEADGVLLGGGASSVCARCHGGTQRSSAVAGSLDTIRAEALRALDAADDALRRADRAGFTVPDASARLEEARAARRRFDVVLHTLDERAVREAAGDITRAATASRRAVRDTLARRDRQRRGWVPAVGILFALSALLALRSRAKETP